jgi:pyruvate,water dikinase
MSHDLRFVRWLATLRLRDAPLVGEASAAAGELHALLAQADVQGPVGFVLTADAWRDALAATDAWPRLRTLLDGLDPADTALRIGRAEQARHVVYQATGNERLRSSIAAAYRAMEAGHGKGVAVAVHGLSGHLHADSLNITRPDELFEACRRCFASQFANRIRQGIDCGEAILPVSVTKLVRAGKAASGVITTLDPASGSRDVLHIRGA